MQVCRSRFVSFPVDFRFQCINLPLGNGELFVSIVIQFSIYGSQESPSLEEVQQVYSGDGTCLADKIKLVKSLVLSFVARAFVCAEVLVEVIIEIGFVTHVVHIELKLPKRYKLCFSDYVRYSRQAVCTFAVDDEGDSCLVDILE